MTGGPGDAAQDLARPTLPAHPADALFDDPVRAALERDALMPYLRRQRWFGGKARDLDRARVVAWARMTGPPAVVCSALVEARYADGGTDQYHLVLTRASAEATGHLLRERPETVVALVGGTSGGSVCDATMDDDACRALASAIARGGEVRAGEGVVAAHPVAASADGVGPLAVTRLAGTHSNSAVILGDRYLLKVFRRVQPGLNPDVEIGRFLAAHPSVKIPALVGSLEYESPGRDPVVVALLQALVRSRTTGWDQALQELERAFRAVGTATPGPAADPLARYAAACGTLGRRTAELHVALAGEPGVPAFAPEPATAETAQAIARGMAEQAGRVLDVLSARRSALDERARPLAERVLADRSAVGSRFEALGRAMGAFTRIRIHGDYHLGQVLVVDDDFVILDFEGEPLKSVAERRAKYSPLRDVAGMRRSFSYAAHTALGAVATDAASAARLEPWVRVWEAQMSGAFVRRYLDTPAIASLLPRDPTQVQAALDLYTLDKAVYELDYEMNNRPAWTHVPLAGLADLLDVGE